MELTNRYRVYSGCNAFYLEDTQTGEEACLGDGVDRLDLVQEYNERIVEIRRGATLCEDMDSEIFCRQWELDIQYDTELLDVLFRREEE